MLSSSMWFLLRPQGEGRVSKEELCSRGDLFAEGSWETLVDEAAACVSLLSWRVGKSGWERSLSSSPLSDRLTFGASGRSCRADATSKFPESCLSGFASSTQTHLLLWIATLS